MKLGIPVVILGVLGVVVGGALYAAHYHRTIGEAGLGLGVVLLIVGAALWMMKEKASTPADTQPVQPAQPANTP